MFILLFFFFPVLFNSGEDKEGRATISNFFRFSPTINLSRQARWGRFSPNRLDLLHTVHPSGGETTSHAPSTGISATGFVRGAAQSGAVWVSVLFLFFPATCQSPSAYYQRQGQHWTCISSFWRAAVLKSCKLQLRCLWNSAKPEY